MSESALLSLKDLSEGTAAAPGPERVTVLCTAFSKGGYKVSLGDDRRAPILLLASLGTENTGGFSP